MKKIAYLFVAAMAVLSFTGCKKKNAMAEAMAKGESFKNDMCKCKDKTCVDGVEAAMKKWQDENKDKMDPNAKPSEADIKKMMAIDEEMRKCKAAAVPAATPPTGDMGSAAATPPPTGDEKKPDDKAAAPTGDEKKMDEKKDEKAPADEKKPEDKKM